MLGRLKEHNCNVDFHPLATHMHGLKMEMACDVGMTYREYMNAVWTNSAYIKTCCEAAVTQKHLTMLQTNSGFPSFIDECGPIIDNMDMQINRLGLVLGESAHLFAQHNSNMQTMAQLAYHTIVDGVGKYAGKIERTQLQC